MMNKGQAKVNTIVFDDFSTGLHQRSGIFADFSNGQSPIFGLKAAASLNNVVVDNGKLRKAKGYTEVLASAMPGAPAVSGMYEYVKEGATKQSYKIVCAGTKVYTQSGSSVTEIYSGITSGNYFSFATFNGVCIMVNGVDAPLQYDGTTCTTVTFTDPNSIWVNAKPKWVKSFRGRLFYAGDNTSPYRVWTPEAGTHDNFTVADGADAFDVGVGDGSRIMGLEVLTKDILIIAKRSSIYRLSGFEPFGGTTDPFVLQEVSRSLGCVSGRTLINVANNVYFLSDRGLKSINVVQEYGDVDQLDPQYALNEDIETFNYSGSAIENAVAVYNPSKQEIILAVPTGSSSQNDKVYVYDTKIGANYVRSGFSVASMAIIGRNLYTGSYVGTLQNHDDNEAYGTSGAIESLWESKWLDFGNATSKKCFEYLNIFFEAIASSTVIIQWQILGQDGSIKTGSKTQTFGSTSGWDVGLWDVAVWDDIADTFFRKNNLGRGRAIKLRFINNSANAPWAIRRIELGVRTLGKVTV